MPRGGDDADTEVWFPSLHKALLGPGIAIPDE